MTRLENCWDNHTGEDLAPKDPEPIGAKSFPVWIPQQFSNLVILHLPAYEDGTARVFRNVGI
jgi:hypothetical protein